MSNKDESLRTGEEPDAEGGQGREEEGPQGESRETPPQKSYLITIIDRMI